MKRLCCLLLLLLFQLMASAGPLRYPLDTAFFHDSDTKHTLDSVVSQDFKPYEGQLRLGFVRGETWIRIRLKDPAALPSETASPLLLRVEPPSLDRLDLYQEQAGGLEASSRRRAAIAAEQQLH